MTQTEDNTPKTNNKIGLVKKLFMNTYTGRVFNPLEMVPDNVAIEDIAHALSMMCRGNGHLRFFYSVGLHSINCAQEAIARGYQTGTVLACLLHDATEAYIADLIRPVKNQLPEYEIMENNLFEVIKEKFFLQHLEEKEWAKVWAIDHEMLSNELPIILTDEPIMEKAPLLSSPILEERNMRAVELEFLKLFTELFETYQKDVKNLKRAQQKRELEAMTPGKRRAEEKRVVEWLKGMPQWIEAKTVALTMPMRMEFQLDLIVQEARSAGKTIFVPVTMPDKTLVFVEWNEQTTFKRTSYGVLEPVIDSTHPLFEAKDLDLIIVPGLLYSTKGDRIGFGGGYYDRTLQKVDDYRILSLAYTTQVTPVADWPVFETDIHIPTIITSEGVVRDV